jgi:hypothetical protein
MNWTEITHWKTHCSPNGIKGTLSRIKTSYLVDGMEHPFWTALNTISPYRPWPTVSGPERGQIRRAAAKLAREGIPYVFYARFLVRFGKSYLKNQSALTITGTKEKVKNEKRESILLEYIRFMNRLHQYYEKDQNIIRGLDALYKNFPSGYRLGIPKYLEVAAIIDNALKTHTFGSILQMITRSASFDEFLKRFDVAKREVKELDLSKGVIATHVPILQKELRIRTGRDPGVPNPALNKYFNKKGRLNLHGLKLIGGH